MRFALALMLIPGLAWGLSPVNNDFKDTSLDVEFKNIYDNAQAKEFRVFRSTPPLSELRNMEGAIVSSNTLVYFIFRADENLYRVNVSCIAAGR